MTFRSWMDGWLNAESEHYEIITPEEFSHACLSQKMAAALKLPRSVLQKVQDKQHFAILLHNYAALTMNMKCCACFSTSSQWVRGQQRWAEGAFVVILILVFILRWEDALTTVTLIHAADVMTLLAQWGRISSFSIRKFYPRSYTIQ